jgi:capsular exopolysaccharide synthesis family protein
MDFVEYLRGIRRRWLIVAAAILVALGAAWFTTETVAPVKDKRQFEASSSILNEGTLSSRSTGGISNNSGTVGALATIGEVPERVATKLDYGGDPLDLAKKVKAEVDQDSGILVVTATTAYPERAVLLANTFAKELVKYLEEQATETIAQEAENLQQRINKLEKETNKLDDQIAAAGEEEAETLRRERDAKIQESAILNSSYQQLTTQATTAGSYEVIQEATARPASSNGLQAPQTRTSRLLLGGVLGLLLGLALALILERFDSRLRSKHQAERHFGIPVIGEIPYVRRWKRADLAVAVQTNPPSEVAHAFRLLGASLIMRPILGNRATADDIIEGTLEPPRTILVTSPNAEEGKTTVVANLAAVFAELGKTVLVLSCDFRRSEIEKFFDVSSDVGGLAAALKRAPGGAILNGHAQDTWVEGVSIVPSGLGPDEPTNLLSSANMRRAIKDASLNADIVLVDTPPVLLFSDAAHLFPEVDAVLLVGREGRTTTDLAEKTSELLERLGAPVIGVAMNATTGNSSPGRYSRRRYVRLPDDPRRGIPPLVRHPEKA